MSIGDCDDRSDRVPIALEIGHEHLDAGSRERALLIASAVAAKCAAPPSGRSSRLTDVTTTCRSPRRATARATRPGSSASTASGRPCVTAQKPQLRVQVSPSSMNVAVWCPQHSPRFGQCASSHTVCSPSSFTTARVSTKPAPRACGP